MTLADVQNLIPKTTATFIDATCKPGEFAVIGKQGKTTVTYYFQGEYGTSEASLVRRVERQLAQNSKGSTSLVDVHFRGDSTTGGERLATAA